jgi:hypothetical protein
MKLERKEENTSEESIIMGPETEEKFKDGRKDFLASFESQNCLSGLIFDKVLVVVVVVVIVVSVVVVEEEEKKAAYMIFRKSLLGVTSRENTESLVSWECDRRDNGM